LQNTHQQKVTHETRKIVTGKARLARLARDATRLARASIHTLQNEGLSTFTMKVRRRLRPPDIVREPWSKTYESEAFVLASWLDCTPQDLERNLALMATNSGSIPIRTINWYLPHFEHAYYGGVYTILRFAAHFSAVYGVQSHFVILGPDTSTTASVYVERISNAFPALQNATAHLIQSDADIPGVPYADACVATFWSTAYYVLKNNHTRRKFYFLQDFEPMFYPAGSTSAQVEATYRFGFYALTNTITLAQHYRQDYGGHATHFTPNIDTQLFHPPQQRDWDRQPYTVFFYGRPGYFRNGFELGAVGLLRLKARLGSRVRIISAGQKWPLADYGLEGVVENLGLLSYQETAQLYRTCDVGLVMMFTRHPSYLPFELMASGCLVVSNINHATSWMLKDGENSLLTLPTASCIADTIVRGLEDIELRQRITHNAAHLIRAEFGNWDRQMEQVYHYMCDPADKASH
jgi:O-antigen biosynthesis protein